MDDHRLFADRPMAAVAILRALYHGRRRHRPTVKKVLLQIAEEGRLIGELGLKAD
jgi:hypothetical protein